MCDLLRIVVATVAIGACSPVLAQSVGAGAYTGFCAMPTTEVVREGDLVLGYASGPQVRRAKDGDRFGERCDNYAILVGALPNLELGISALVASPLNGMLDDRSVAFKYRVLGGRPDGLSLAVGSTDVQGTKRRATDYGIAGWQRGRLRLYGGYGRGLLGGMSGGATYRVDRYVNLGVESIGGRSAFGLFGSIGDRIGLSCALDEDRRMFVSAGYAFPLRTPEPADPVASPGDLDALRGTLERLCHGAVRIQTIDTTLSVSYEDVEVRDPVGTFGQALRVCSAFAKPPIDRLSLTVSRFGRDLATISGRTNVVSSYLHGFMDEKEFLADVAIEDGGPSTVLLSETAAPRPKSLITFEPGIDYQLGLKDRLPNREWLRAQAAVPLPLGLVAAAAQDVALNDSTESEGTNPGPSLGLYRLDRFGGAWSAVGLDHDAGGEWFATAQAAYHVSRPDLRLLGNVSKSVESGSSEPVRYAVEAGLDAMHGTASVWARHERFEMGDVGETFGLTRRFGRTEIQMTWATSRQNGETLRRAGVALRLPLPEARADVGGLRLATAGQAAFSYRPTEHTEPALGKDTPRRLVFSVEDDLTARGLLTAEMLRAQVSRMRRRP